VTEKDEQLEHFRDVVDREAQDAEAKSRATQRDQAKLPTDDEARGAQPSVTEPGRPQDAFSARNKNAGKGKKTADKWNQ
jgi:hypothetical protein